MGIFGNKEGVAPAAGQGGRAQRHSSGWGALSKHLTTNESLRVLDIGPTSASNINFITSLGHSIYMANLAEDAARPEYQNPDGFDPEKFVSGNLDFAGRAFDVVTFWDTADYLPAPALQPVIDRIFEVMQPGGVMLAFFHSKATGDETTFTRYHLTERDELSLQRVGQLPLLHTYTNRQVEGMFQHFAGHKFFLAKDTLREVLINR